MMRNWKSIQLGIALIVAVCGFGCSGVRYSRSVSPLDFILPGLMQNNPSSAPATETPGTQPVPVLALAN